MDAPLASEPQRALDCAATAAKRPLALLDEAAYDLAATEVVLAPR